MNKFIIVIFLFGSTLCFSQNPNVIPLSGFIGLKSDGSLDSSSIENETKQILNSIKVLLEANQMSLKNVIKTTIYVTDLKNFKKINETYATYFTENPPARETVQVKSIQKGAHIEIAFVFSPTFDQKIILTDKAPKPIDPYSQAVKSGGVLYLSGQIALKTDGALDSTSIQNETAQIISNIKAILEADQMTLKNLITCKVYVTNMTDLKKIDEIYYRSFGKKSPIREVVEVKALPKGAHVEISVIAAH